MDDVKILIVDDRSENLVAMQKTLAPLKLHIITALSGNEALKLMLEHDFSVILLDVMMPDINGFEVAKLMHENDMTKHIPIIFITAINKTEQYYIQGMEAGAIDYLYKPIDPTILLSKVRIFVDLYTIRNKLEKTIGELNSFQAQLQETNLKLKKLSEEDMLTKVANRRYFEDEMNNLIAASEKVSTKFTLFFFDVDNFKYINDEYGHGTGDLVLKILAERINKVANSIKIIARLGGDEFAMVISDLSDNNTTEIIAKQILKAIESPFICDDKSVQISISIGIASYPVAATTLTGLLRAADLALYQAKSAGKNTYCIYDAAMSRK